MQREDPVINHGGGGREGGPLPDFSTANENRVILAFRSFHILKASKRDEAKENLSLSLSLSLVWWSRGFFPGAKRRAGSKGKYARSQIHAVAQTITGRVFKPPLREETVVLFNGTSVNSPPFSYIYPLDSIRFTESFLEFAYTPRAPSTFPR